MEKNIAPISNPDDIRAEAAQQQQAKIDTAQNMPKPPQPVNNVDTSSIYPISTITSRDAQRLIATEKPKPLIGLYIIVGIVLLGAFFQIVDNHEGTFGLFAGIAQALLGLGLLTRHEIARKIYVVLGWINVVLSGSAAIGLSAINSKAAGAVLVVSFFSLIIDIAILIYLSTGRVKAQFE